MITPSIYDLNTPFLDKTTHHNAPNSSTLGHIVLAMLGFLLGLLLQFSSLSVFWMLERKVTGRLAIEIFAVWSFMTTFMAMTITVVLGYLLSGRDTLWIQTIEVVGIIAAMIGAGVGIAISSVALDVEMNLLGLAIILVCHSAACLGVVKWSERYAQEEENDMEATEENDLA